VGRTRLHGSVTKACGAVAWVSVSGELWSLPCTEPSRVHSRGRDKAEQVFCRESDPSLVVLQCPNRNAKESGDDFGPFFAMELACDLAKPSTKIKSEGSTSASCFQRVIRHGEGVLLHACVWLLAERSLGHPRPPQRESDERVPSRPLGPWPAKKLQPLNGEGVHETCTLYSISGGTATSSELRTRLAVPRSRPSQDLSCY
jgi:hypothetical protein